MSSKLWLGKDDGKGFSTRATANKFLVQRGLVGGQVTRGPDGRWFLDMTGQHIPKEYAHRVIGSPEAIRRATTGRPWEDNDNDPIDDAEEGGMSWEEILQEKEKIRKELSKSQSSSEGAESQPKRVKGKGGTSTKPSAPERSLQPYAQANGYLNADLVAKDFDVRTIESLLQDKDLTPEEKASLKEVRAGLVAEAQYQKVQDTLSDKESWQLQSQQKVDSRAYDAYNKRIGEPTPLEALQKQLRGQMEVTAQSNFNEVLKSQEEATKRENNIGLAKWRQQQSEERRTLKLQDKEEVKASTQESNIGLAMWRQQQRNSEKEVKYFQSEEERYAQYWQNPESESVMEKLQGKVLSKSNRTNQDSVQRLIDSLSGLSKEVDKNTEQLEEANGDSGDGKGGKGGKKGEDTKEGDGLVSTLTSVLKPVMLVLEAVGAVGFAAAGNAKRELVGANSSGLSRQHYAGLINKLGVGTDLGGQLVSNASNSVISALRNPDSIASSLEQALTANALLGGPQLDAASIVQAQLSGDTAGLMDVMQKYNKQASPMQVAAVSGVYGQNLASLSKAEGFSTDDVAQRTGVDEQVWRGLERASLVLSNTLGGDLNEAANQAATAVGEVADGMGILSTSIKGSVGGYFEYLQKALGGSKSSSESLSDKIQSTSGTQSFSASVTQALKESSPPADIPNQVEDEGDYILQEDGGHLDKSSGLVNYALEAERNQAHLIQATNNQSTQKVEVVANVAVQGHMTTDDGRAIPLKLTGKEVKVTGAGGSL